MAQTMEQVYLLDTTPEHVVEIGGLLLARLTREGSAQGLRVDDWTCKPVRFCPSTGEPERYRLTVRYTADDSNVIAGRARPAPSGLGDGAPPSA